MAKDIPISSDTKTALRRAIEDSGGLRRWAAMHGLSPAIVSDILAGHDEDVSVRSENRVRVVLGLPPIPPRLPAACCPDCLERGIEVVHGDGLRCHGKQGTPTILAPNERVIRRNGTSRRKRYLRLAVGDLPPDVAEWWRKLTPAQRAKAIAAARSEEA